MPRSEEVVEGGSKKIGNGRTNGKHTTDLNRRSLLVSGGAVLATGVSGLLLPARAEGLAPTASMSGANGSYGADPATKATHTRNSPSAVSTR